MDWEKLLRLAPGETLVGELADVLDWGAPIIELSEAVLPRQVLLARDGAGSDILASILYNRRHDTYTMRARFRDPEGYKRVMPPVRWLPAEHGETPAVLAEAFHELAKNARQDGAKVARLTFPATADLEEVIRIFTESGEFDVFQGQEKTIRRLA